MAYSTSSPPTLLVGSLENTAPNIWGYASGDAVATVAAANYITNALALGMKKGDIVIVYNNSGSALVSICIVLTVASSGADLSDGTAITATNSG